jgi:hypothetical protein
MQKARGHPLNPAEAGNHRAPTACKCMVSDSFRSPNRGSFHLSLALLITIGRRVVLSLGGWAPRLHTEFHELRATLERQHKVRVFAYRTITFYGSTFQRILLTFPLLMSAPATPSPILNRKIEIRNPKSKIRNKFKTLNSNFQNPFRISIIW